MDALEVLAGAQPACGAADTHLAHRGPEAFLQILAACILEPLAQQVAQAFADAFLDPLADGLLQAVSECSEKAFAVDAKAAL